MKKMKKHEGLSPWFRRWIFSWMASAATWAAPWLHGKNHTLMSPDPTVAWQGSSFAWIRVFYHRGRRGHRDAIAAAILFLFSVLQGRKNLNFFPDKITYFCATCYFDISYLFFSLCPRCPLWCNISDLPLTQYCRRRQYSTTKIESSHIAKITHGKSTAQFLR